MPESMISQWLLWAQSVSKRARLGLALESSTHMTADDQVKLAAPEGDAHEDLRRYLSTGEAEAAFVLHQRKRKQLGKSWRLSEDDHLHLISALRKQEKWEAAVEMMVQYLRTPQSKATLVRLALAQLLLNELRRPGQALQVLTRLDGADLTPKQYETLIKLRERAERARQKNPSEVTVEDW